MKKPVSEGARFRRLAPAGRVGAGYFARTGEEVSGEARGLVGSLAELAHPGIHIENIHTNVAAFFERTGELELVVRSRWRFPFSLAWALGRPFFRAIGQLVLPRRGARIATRVVPLDPVRDGRSGVRGVVRTYLEGDAAGQVMQVVAYGTWERAGVWLMSAAFPVPFGHLAGFLRLDPLDDDGSVELTSTARGDDAGVWVVLGTLAIPVPFGESLRFWAPGAGGIPADLSPEVMPGATLLARHEQRFCGLPIVVHDYGFRPSSAATSGAGETPAPDREPPP